METTRPALRLLLPLAIAGALFASGCNSKPANNEQPQQSASQPQQPPAGDQSMNSANPGQPVPAPNQAPPAPVEPPPPPPPVTYTIPAGAHISVSLGQTIDSKTATEGQSFPATVTSPVSVGGTTVIRPGASASGTVVATKSRGKFKGEGYLQLRLDSVRANGRTYPIASSTYERVEKGKGKRSAAFIGGGGGAGALIGGLAGGGKGALIGGLVGAGAGTAGTALTDNKPVTLPAETVITFTLARSLTVSQ
jgi:hypothetical protein